MQNVFKRVQSILAGHLNIDLEKITLETTFAELEVDSLDLVEMIMTVEEEFDIEISDEQLVSLQGQGVRQVVEYILQTGEQ